MIIILKEILNYFSILREICLRLLSYEEAIKEAETCLFKKFHRLPTVNYFIIFTNTIFIVLVFKFLLSFQITVITPNETSNGEGGKESKPSPLEAPDNCHRKKRKETITLWVTEEDIEEVLNDLREIESFSYSLKIGGEHKRKKK